MSALPPRADIRQPTSTGVRSPQIRGITRWAPNAARSGEHDDLVLAVALAVWGGVTMNFRRRCGGRENHAQADLVLGLGSET